MKIGITGGLACGKTTVLKIFKSMGFQVLNTDEIGHELLRRNAAVREAVEMYFGKNIWKEDGSVDRVQLANRVFSDVKALNFLEELLHPRIEHSIVTAMEDASVNWAVEIPLLFEKHFEKYFDGILCVITTVDLQKEFLLKSNLSWETAELRIKHQMPIKEKILRADFVVSNTGSLEFLESQVVGLIGELKVAF